MPQFDSAAKELDSLISTHQYIDAYRRAVSYESLLGNTSAGSDTVDTFRAYVNLSISTLKKLIAIPSTPDSTLQRIELIVTAQRNEFIRLNAGDSATIHFLRADSAAKSRLFQNAFAEYILADYYRTIYMISERMRLDNNYKRAEEYARLSRDDEVKNLYNDFLNEPESSVLISIKSHLDRKYRALLAGIEQRRDDEQIRQHRTTYVPTFHGSEGYS